MSVQRCIKAFRPAAVVLLLVAAGDAAAADIAPHRALYAMSWDEPNLLVWFCVVGGLTCSAVLGALGFRLAASRGTAVS